MTASKSIQCPVKWSTKPENTKMLGKLIVVNVYMQKSFFGFFIDAGASKGDLNYSSSNNNPAGRLIQQYIQSASSLD